MYDAFSAPPQKRKSRVASLQIKDPWYWSPPLSPCSPPCSHLAVPVVRDESVGDCPLEKAVNGEHCFVRSVFVVLRCCLGNQCFCQENFKNGRHSAQGSSYNWAKLPARVQNTFQLSDLSKAVCRHLRIWSSFLKWGLNCLLLRGKRQIRLKQQYWLENRLTTAITWHLDSWHWCMYTTVTDVALLFNCTGPWISVVKNPTDTWNSVSELAESHNPWQSQTSGWISWSYILLGPTGQGSPTKTTGVFRSHSIPHQNKPEKAGWKNPRTGHFFMLALGLDVAHVHMSSASPEIEQRPKHSSPGSRKAP